MKAKLVGWLLALGWPATGLLAQGVAVPQGVTTLVLSAYDVRVANNPVPAGRVRVPPLEAVTLQAPSLAGPLQWWKNNQPVPGATGTSLVLPLVTSADSGFYNVVASGNSTVAATGVNLDVVLPGHLGNLSSLVTLSAGGTQTLGFSVGGSVTKYLLVRAVGPSLAAFGVTNPVKAPRFRIFDSHGTLYDPTRAAFSPDWAKVFAAAGAFPLTRDGDAWDWFALTPGTYTIQATDANNQGGMLLLEVYEFPASALSGTTATIP